MSEGLLGSTFSLQGLFGTLWSLQQICRPSQLLWESKMKVLVSDFVGILVHVSMIFHGKCFKTQIHGSLSSAITGEDWWCRTRGCQWTQQEEEEGWFAILEFQGCFSNAHFPEFSWFGLDPIFVSQDLENALKKLQSDEKYLKAAARMWLAHSNHALSKLPLSYSPKSQDDFRNISTNIYAAVYACETEESKVQSLFQVRTWEDKPVSGVIKVLLLQQTKWGYHRLERKLPPPPSSFSSPPSSCSLLGHLLPLRRPLRRLPLQL